MDEDDFRRSSLNVLLDIRTYLLVILFLVVALTLFVAGPPLIATFQKPAPISSEP